LRYTIQSRLDGQGPRYRPPIYICIFYGNRDEKRIAKETILSLKKVGMRVCNKTYRCYNSIGSTRLKRSIKILQIEGGRAILHSYRRLF